MKLRDRIAQLEAELAAAHADLAASQQGFDEAVQALATEVVDALIANPAQLRAVILNHASLAHSPRDLMAALRALDTVDNA